MNNGQELHYVELDDTVEVKKPAQESRAKGVLSLVFGIVSIVLGGIIGIVLGALARRFATPILADFGGTTTAKLAKAGRITGTIGLILSIVGLVLTVICVAVIIVLIIAMLDGVAIGSMFF